MTYSPEFALRFAAYKAALIARQIRIDADRARLVA